MAWNPHFPPTPVNSGAFFDTRQLGPSTRVVETALKCPRLVSNIAQYVVDICTWDRLKFRSHRTRRVASRCVALTRVNAAENKTNLISTRRYATRRVLCRRSLSLTLHVVWFEALMRSVWRSFRLACILVPPSHVLHDCLLSRKKETKPKKNWAAS